MDKQKQLEAIARQIERCRECKKGKSGLSVPGEGNADADIVFLGEAPGRQEAATGRPFIGRSGQLLRQLIRQSGLREADVFITSPVKYLPDRGTPTKEDIAHGRVHLDKQLAVIKPKVIVLLGSTACFALLHKTIPVLKHHAEITREGGRTYFITLHPAAAIRFVKFKKVLVEDFKKLKSLIR